MRVHQLFILGARIIGQTEYEASSLPRSFAYFCPTCGEVWGRIAVADLAGGPGIWEVLHSPCERHHRAGVQDWSAIPGGFSDYSRATASELPVQYRSRAIESFPAGILQRELNLVLSEIERIYND